MLLSIEKNKNKEINGIYKNDLLANSFKEYYSDNQTSKFKFIRNIHSLNRGFVVKELYIVPLNLSLEGYINLNFNNGSTIKIQIGGSQISNIIIDKIPKGSFYQAKDADNFKLSPYLNEETVQWSASNLEQGIRFAYIVEPFNYLNWALRPLLKISSLPGVIFTFFGAIITFLLSLRFKPIVNVQVKAIANAEGILMTESSKYDMRGANFQGGFAETNYGKMIENQHNYDAQSNLVEAAAQIQQLLKQLEATNPTTTEIEKLAVVAKASEEIKKNSTLKAQIINALKAGGTEAFKEAVDHPLVNVLIATVQGWQEAK
ncbi:hypothetical protein H6G81_28300 [Scytonema hofmannii FACHB-248]|uniref:Uncharacterized protein n=1 Tax=Scytonema hofmannii FACHB-248 TaxID=1842502 RepID=A0ABR8GY13_9CYAN|nr:MULTISPECIES: hypothetical protein [Nostocales]MBD2608313.1 hypothetical protein [Scytonema hofmannii FACHB-248]